MLSFIFLFINIYVQNAINTAIAINNIYIYFFK